jgi:uncharacterized membrane protein
MSLQEPNPPLYDLLLHSWMRVFGSGEAAVRLLSAFLGTLHFPPLYLLGKRLFSPRVALRAAVLSAFNPFLVWYSQEARMYALVATLTLRSFHSFMRAVDTPRWTWWAAYGAVTVAGLCTHFYAVYVLPAQLLYLLLPYARGQHTAQGARYWSVRRAFCVFALALEGVGAQRNSSLVAPYYRSHHHACSVPGDLHCAARAADGRRLGGREVLRRQTVM